MVPRFSPPRSIKDKNVLISLYFLVLSLSRYSPWIWLSPENFAAIFDHRRRQKRGTNKTISSSSETFQFCFIWFFSIFLHLRFTRIVRIIDRVHRGRPRGGGGALVPEKSMKTKNVFNVPARNKNLLIQLHISSLPLHEIYSHLFQITIQLTQNWKSVENVICVHEGHKWRWSHSKLLPVYLCVLCSITCCFLIIPPVQIVPLTAPIHFRLPGCHISPAAAREWALAPGKFSENTFVEFVFPSRFVIMFDVKCIEITTSVSRKRNVFAPPGGGQKHFVYLWWVTGKIFNWQYLCTSTITFIKQIEIQNIMTLHYKEQQHFL